MPDMTPEQEAKFFETGELPPEIAAEAATPEPVVEAPAAPVAVPAAPTPHADPYAALQRQLIEAESRRAASEQQLNDLVAQLQALQEQPAEAPPDPNVDPFGHLQHQVANINAAIQNLQGNLTAQTEQAQQAAQLQQFIGHVHTLRDEFLKTAPDFMDAYKHIRETRANDLRDAGIPEHALPAALLQDEMTIAQAAIAAGKNPAAALYDMAKRHGYMPRTATPAAGVPGATNPILAAAQARLAQVQAGQAAATNVPRGAAEVVLTLESLKDASDADMNKLVQSDDLWNKVAGGRATGKDIFS